MVITPAPIITPSRNHGNHNGHNSEDNKNSNDDSDSDSDNDDSSDIPVTQTLKKSQSVASNISESFTTWAIPITVTWTTKVVCFVFTVFLICCAETECL